jgi:hypothetical protein
MVVNPAAGPLTLSDDPLKDEITIPPTTPAMIPENNGAPDAKATPRHKGSATKNTTMPEGTSLRQLVIGFNCLLISRLWTIGNTKE